MGDISLLTICSAIADTLGAAFNDAWQAQEPPDLKEAIPDTPILQVYPDAGTTEVSDTDRISMRGGIRRLFYTVSADLYARQRAHIGEDMHALLPLIDAIQAELEKQDVKPYFGLQGSGIKAYRWEWERVTFDYAGVSYIGARFTIYLTIF